MKNNIDSIFVYGTLRKQGVLPISEFLKNRVDFLGQATISGKIYLVDYYPGLVLTDHEENLVQGEVYRLHDIRDLLSLDEYEGVSVIPSPRDLFKKAIVESTLQSGLKIECLVYEYNRPITAAMKWIRSGDYFIL